MKVGAGHETINQVAMNVISVGQKNICCDTEVLYGLPVASTVGFYSIEKCHLYWRFNLIFQILMSV